MLLRLFSFCDAPQHYQCTIQDPATNVLEWMIDLYDLLCFDLIIVVSVIFVLLLSILFSPLHLDNEKRYSDKFFSHSTYLEIFWTIVPALLLITIAYPSFNLLYALDEEFDYIEFVYKIIGHQWYWTYEYHMGLMDVQFDSYMMDSSSFDKFYYVLKQKVHKQEYHYLRLLEVDNRLFMPVNAKAILLITSADVLHSWTIPAFGIKVDACPGRLTKANLEVKRPGVYYGQCSEICGVNHGFMPIVVQVEPDERRAFVVDKSFMHRSHFQKTGEIYVPKELSVIIVRYMYHILGLQSSYPFEPSESPYGKGFKSTYAFQSSKSTHGKGAK